MHSLKDLEYLAKHLHQAWVVSVEWSMRGVGETSRQIKAIAVAFGCFPEL